MKTAYDMSLSCSQLISIRYSGYIMKTTNIYMKRFDFILSFLMKITYS